MPPLQSPSGSAIDALAEVLAERERTKQQALMNAHTALQDQLDQRRAANEEQVARNQLLWHTQASQEQAQAKAEAQAEKERVNAANEASKRFGPGDILSTTEDVGLAQKGGLYMAPAAPNDVGPVQPGQVPLNQAVRIIGDYGQRNAQAKMQAAAQFVADDTAGKFDDLKKSNPSAYSAMYKQQTGSEPPAYAMPPETVQRDVMDASGRVIRTERVPKGTITERLSQPPQNAASLDAQMDPETIDMLARAYALEGPQALANLGIGNAGVALKERVLSRVNKFNPSTNVFDAQKPPDLPALRQRYGANQTALAANEKTLAAAQAFSEAADLNRGLFDGILKDVPDTGSSWLNMPYRAIARGLGSTAMSQFDALRTSLQNEYARIVSSPGMTGVVSDAMRKELHTILDPNATVSQMQAALSALSSEAKNRQSAYESERKRLQSVFGSDSERQQANTPQTPTPTITADDILNAWKKKKGGG